jgi:hypothetical protein
MKSHSMPIPAGSPTMRWSHHITETVRYGTHTLMSTRTRPTDRGRTPSVRNPSPHQRPADRPRTLNVRRHHTHIDRRRHRYRHQNFGGMINYGKRRSMWPPWRDRELHRHMSKLWSGCKTPEFTPRRSLAMIISTKYQRSDHMEAFQSDPETSQSLAVIARMTRIYISVFAIRFRRDK